MTEKEKQVGVSSPSPSPLDDSYETQPKNKLWRWADKLAIETGGIQRVTDDLRQQHPTHVWQATTFWFSANFAVATLSTGMLGPIFGLHFWQSVAVIISVNSILCACPAWVATFGLTGLRMSTFTRYSFGYWGNCICVVFILISNVGWAAINGIAGASCWTAVSDGRLPLWAGVIIISVAVWLLCIGGIAWIHRIDSFLWILPVIVWCVAAGTGAKHFRDQATPGPAAGTAAVLSFIAVNISWAISWSYLTADYNVRMPINTPKWRLLVTTYVGIWLPTILVMILGAAMYSGVSDVAWSESYAAYGVGGPLAKALEPAGGFGKFLLVLAGLSSVANNIPNGYSFAIAAQNFGPWAVRVPRVVFVTMGFIVSVVVGCLASLSFEESLITLLDILGYWCVILLVVVAEEHVIFRGSSWQRYDFDAWNDPSSLPFGWAGIAAFIFGFLGALMGMAETWYTSPIAKLIGGGNIGHELTCGFTAVTYPVFRWLELKFTGR